MGRLTLSLCIRPRLSIRRVPRAGRRQTGHHGDPEGQPLPGALFAVAPAAGISAALGQRPRSSATGRPCFVLWISSMSSPQNPAFTVFSSWTSLLRMW